MCELSHTQFFPPMVEFGAAHGDNHPMNEAKSKPVVSVMGPKDSAGRTRKRRAAEREQAREAIYREDGRALAEQYEGALADYYEALNDGASDARLDTLWHLAEKLLDAKVADDAR